MHRAGVSEFPNDNPLLHHGAIWVMETPCGALESIPPEPPAEDADPAEEGPVSGTARSNDRATEDAVEDDTPVEAMHSFEESGEVALEEMVGAAELADVPMETITPPAEAADPFDDFVRAMVSIAALEDAHSVTEVLPRLLEPGPIAEHALEPERVAALLSGGWVARGADGLYPSERLTSVVHAWQGVLRTGDFSACGESMLNEWGAELLAALLAAPARAQALSYELRRRGVAAFGMVKLAA